MQNIRYLPSGEILGKDALKFIDDADTTVSTVPN
jgi:hypothetical protein